MGLKKWEEAFKPMGKPNGFKHFEFKGWTPIPVHDLKGKDFFWENGKFKSLSEEQKPWPLVSPNRRKEKLRSQKR